MITIRKENWFITIGEKMPTIECPSCGALLLSDRAPHGIHPDGKVYNSVVCPCGFHDYVQIEGWQGGHIERGLKTK